MDTSKLIEITLKNSKSVSKNKKLYFRHFAKSKPLSHFDSLQEQRKSQRLFIFWFSIITSSLSLAFLGYLIYTQAQIRIIGKDSPEKFSILNGHELEILSVAIFGQIIGVIHLITKSLWNEEPFKEILKADHEKKYIN